MKFIQNSKITLFICLMLLSITAFSQEEHSKHNSEEQHEFKRNVITVLLSHTYINSAKENPDGSNWIAAPSFTFNYNFNFNHTWAIGLHNDIIIRNIDLEDTHDGGDGIKRELPISSAIMLIYKPFQHLAFIAGGGMEFSKHENFEIIRFGFESPIHLPNNWEIQASLTADIGIEAYNSITFGFGIAKLF